MYGFGWLVDGWEIGGKILTKLVADIFGVSATCAVDDRGKKVISGWVMVVRSQSKEDGDEKSTRGFALGQFLLVGGQIPADWVADISGVAPYVR